MSKIIKNIGTVQVLQDTSVNEATYVKKGYVLFAEPTQKQKNLSDQKPNVATGGVYEKSNISRSYINLNNIGTLIGSLTLENIPDNDPDEVIYNYITSLIPGIYPSISGPWSPTQSYYNYQEIIDYINQKENVYFCKSLGMGLGEISSWRVSDVSRSGLSTVANNVIQVTDTQGFVEQINELGIINYSSIVDGMVEPETRVGENYYMRGFSWPNYYGINVINGTNTFPFFGWAGSRIGSLEPQSFQFQQNSLFNWPNAYLQLSKNYNPLGIIYAGQGVQCNSYPVLGSGRNLTFEERNKRTYQETIQNNETEIKYTGITPYQQGRGSWDFFAREVTYNKTNGLADKLDTQAIIPTEGVIPGRNNAFMGVVLTDYWSDTLNLNNTENSSRTSKDTRSTQKGLKQSKTAHNSPLSYISSNGDNTFNPLPWNSLWSYIGTTTTSSSNERSDNTPILKEGITTMCISGAYPLYRGAHSSKWNGAVTLFFNSTAQVYDQYYSSQSFWDPNYKDPFDQLITEETNVVIPPNPPYRIKGGKIILFNGQKVKAGSYVYSSMHCVGNVSVPQYYGPAAKDIVLNEGERDQLIGDTYSKFQANQGSLIVMVSIDGEEPPNPPPCAQPVGIVLEDVEGFGEPLYNNDNIADNLLYSSYTEASGFLTKKLTFNLQNTNCIQARNIMIKTFPMYPNLSLSSVTSGKLWFFVSNFAFPNNVVIGDPSIPPGLSGGTASIAPIMLRIKSNYIVNAGGESVGQNRQLGGSPSIFEGLSLQQKEFLCEWPPIGG